MIQPFLTEKSTLSAHVASPSKSCHTNPMLFPNAESNYAGFYFEDGLKKLCSVILKMYELLLQGIFNRGHQSCLVNHKFITRYQAKYSKKLHAYHADIPVSRKKKSFIVAYFKNPNL